MSEQFHISEIFLQVTWYLLIFLNLQTSLILEISSRRMMESIFCIYYRNKVHPGFKSQLHFNYFFNISPVSLHISPFQLPVLHSPSDFLPPCITSPETSFSSGSLTEDRQERKKQVILQSGVTTPPKANFNFFFFNLTPESIRPEISKAWPENIQGHFCNHSENNLYMKV